MLTLNEIEQYKEVGKAFAEGVIISLAKYALLLAFIAAVANYTRKGIGAGMDDTDKDSWHRSGLYLYTDNKTGVQYLSDGKGGLTPRLPAPQK